MYSRQIDVEKNLVFFRDELSVSADCSALAAQNIKFICEQRDKIWVEREPFEGRETDFDFGIAYSMFSDAEAKYMQEQNELQEIYDSARDYVTLVQLVRAADELNLLAALQAWVESPDRTFLEQTEWRGKMNFHRNCELLGKITQTLGLTEQQFTSWFELAKTIDHNQ
jgi:hypothetical protein